MLHRLSTTGSALYREDAPEEDLAHLMGGEWVVTCRSKGLDDIGKYLAVGCYVRAVWG